MNSSLSPKEALFVKNLSKGHSTKDAALLAGYSESSISSYPYILKRKLKIIKALENKGLSDEYLAKSLKKNIDSGMGVKATADTSLRGIEIVSRLKGYLDNDKPQAQTESNIYINELKILNINELQAKADKLTEELASLKDAQAQG